MNGKKARALRFKAQAQTIGKPDREYYVAKASNPRQGAWDPVLGYAPVITPPGTFALTAGCTRAVYKRLKKAA